MLKTVAQITNPSFPTTIGVGGATPATSGAGVTFPATQNQSSNVNTLDDYEEGLWSPNQGSGLTVVGAFSSSGTYTKIGRQVSVSGVVTGATSISVGAVGQICTNMPFQGTAAANIGNVVAGSLTASGQVILGSTILYSISAISGGTTLNFSLTYETNQ